jgi:hypothetical protein
MQAKDCGHSVSLLQPSSTTGAAVMKYEISDNEQLNQ